MANRNQASNMPLKQKVLESEGPKMKLPIMLQVVSIILAGCVSTAGSAFAQTPASRTIYAVVRTDTGDFPIVKIEPASQVATALYTLVGQTNLTVQEVASQDEIARMTAYVSSRLADNQPTMAPEKARISLEVQHIRVSPTAKYILLAALYKWCYVPGDDPCFGSHQLLLMDANTTAMSVIVSFPLTQAALLSEVCQVQATIVPSPIEIRDVIWSPDSSYLVVALQGTGRGCGNYELVNSNLLFVNVSEGTTSTLGEGVAWSFNFNTRELTLLNRQCYVNDPCQNKIERVLYSTSGIVISRERLPISQTIRPHAVNGLATSEKAVVFYAAARLEPPDFGYVIVHPPHVPDASNLVRGVTNTPPIRFVSLSNTVDFLLQTTDGALWKASITKNDELNAEKFYAGPVESFELGADGTLLVREAGTRYAIISADGVKLHEVDLLQALSKSSSAPATLSEDMIVAVSW
jgi:hypothetical protein